MCLLTKVSLRKSVTTLTIKVVDVQQVKRPSNSSFVAVAFYSLLAAKIDPRTVEFKEHCLRDDFINHLEKNNFTGFGNYGIRKHKRVAMGEVPIELWCSCRMPYHSRMVLCRICETWLHVHCESTELNDNNNKKHDYKCRTCLPSGIPLPAKRQKKY